MPKVVKAIEEQTPLQFMLLGFPFKSLNALKVLGDYPDYAELLSLDWLNRIAKRVAMRHEPGVEIILGSDGIALNDLVYAPDHTVQSYTSEVRRMINKEGYVHLRHFSLEDMYPSLTDPKDLRAQIPTLPDRDVDSLHKNILTDPGLMFMVNGISRFMVDDFTFQFRNDGLSRSALQKKARQSAYAIVSRSEGLRALYQEQFPNSVRLSVHPQPQDAEKIGIKMMETETDAWATPWHTTAAEVAPGSFIFRKLHELEENGIRRFAVDDQGRRSYAVMY